MVKSTGTGIANIAHIFAPMAKTISTPEATADNLKFFAAMAHTQEPITSDGQIVSVICGLRHRSDSDKTNPRLAIMPTRQSKRRLLNSKKSCPGAHGANRSYT